MEAVLSIQEHKQSTPLTTTCRKSQTNHASNHKKEGAETEDQRNVGKNNRTGQTRYKLSQVLYQEE